MTDLFFALTPDWVIRSVEAAGLEPSGHCMSLHAFENRVYDLMLEDESHVVVKFYRPGRWTKEAILEEHAFLFDLREAEIPVCAPLRFEDGQSLHEVEGIHYAVWPRTGGRSPDELSDQQVEILGRLLARMHNAGAARTLKHRPSLDAKTYVSSSLQFLESGKLLPREWEARYRGAAQRIAQIYEERRQGVPLHRIHGDCHLANILHGREGWFFLDFDDLVSGPAVQDVWMMLPGRDEEGRRQRKLLIEAYRQFRPFEERWLSLVEPLRGMRYIHYAAWIARRWNDPAFPSAFPHFNTPTYWQKEAIDLEEQVRRCFEAEGSDGREE